MAKKYVSKEEKEKRVKKALKIGGIVFAVLVVLLIAVGIAAPRVSERALRLGMQFDYMKDPWDGGGSLGFLSKKGDVWLYYEALMCIEDDALKSDSRGVVFSSSAGNVLCADLSNIKDKDLFEAVKKMYGDYAARKGMTFKCASMEELKADGKIDAGAGGGSAYVEGCLLQILENEWDKEHLIFSNQIFFYYSSTVGRGATVAVSRSADKEILEKTYNGDGKETVSNDGEWAAVIASSMIT